MQVLDKGQAYVNHDGNFIYHDRQCCNVALMADPDVVDIDELPADARPCQHCQAAKARAAPLDSTIPETVACPCGNGYAERRDDPIIERVNRSWDQRQVTYNYRHEGCPVGGHIVMVAGLVRIKAGPLFNPDTYSQRAIGEATVLADGGFLEGEEVCPESGRASR